ncbi:MAG TPA: carboxypeptidase-like regulatory domain-containing protein [Candidatus Limnocylindrales bacterium]|nr:carboxypeptidase-like regulatory domain-containing protein [Candidatus Limnocylindrales bacterium]
MLASEPGIDLKGVVKGQGSGGLTNGSVFVYTAGPRLGAGLLCPSCYPDCRKSAKSGPNGQFKIESLATNLLFQVLVVAPGHMPTFFSKVDPVKGPLEAVLQPRLGTNIPLSQTILGRVLNSKKEPVANAVVSVNSTTIGDRTSSRPPTGTDPLVITDEHGEFSLQSQGKFDAMSLKIEAQALATSNFEDVRPGPTRREFVLSTGASLTGRVLFRHQPLGDITVGVVGSDRTMGNFTGDFVIRTSDNGRFLFVNLPPNRNYDLYGLMESMRPFGALPVRSLRLGGDDSETNAGDLIVEPGLRLAGKVELADGRALPEHTRVLLGRPGAWDTLTAELPPDGHFEFTNVPSETVTLGTRVGGYRFSARNASLDRLNPFELVGRLNTDTTNLVLLLEPGENLTPDYSIDPEEERPDKLPLGGAEAKRKILNAVTFSGQVLDAATQAPVAQFRITPGLRRNPQMKGWVEWHRSKAVQGTNGVFSLDYSLKAGALVLLAEADGYLPAESEELRRDNTTSIIQLKKGAGPSGKLLLPDGKPADGVTVCYLVAREQASLNNSDVISVYQNREGSTTLTDPSGEFSFAPKLGEGEIFAASSRGFAHCKTSELTVKGKLVLEAWGSIRGRVMQDSKPIAGEGVEIGLPRDGSTDRPWFNLPSTRTDEEGRFSMNKVPAGELELRTRVPLGAGSWTSQTQRKFTLKPAEQLDLGVINKAAASARK